MDGVEYPVNFQRFAEASTLFAAMADLPKDENKTTDLSFLPEQAHSQPVSYSIQDDQFQAILKFIEILHADPNDGIPVPKPSHVLGISLLARALDTVTVFDYFENAMPFFGLPDIVALLDDSLSLGHTELVFCLSKEILERAAKIVECEESSRAFMQLSLRSLLCILNPKSKMNRHVGTLGAEYAVLHTGDLDTKNFSLIVQVCIPFSFFLIQTDSANLTIESCNLYVSDNIYP